MNNPLPRMKRDWEEMTPREKALATTITLGVTLINPLYPLTYLVAYTAYSAGKADDQEGS